METIYVALDVETTGLDTGVDEIIELAAVKFRGAEVLDTFEQLIKPRHSVPLKTQRLTGITEAELADAPRFRDVAPAFVRFIKNYPLVGHTVSFDLGMLRAAGMSFTQTAYDTFELATLLLPQVSVYKLDTLAEHLGIEHTNHHRALHDAQVCRRLFLKLLDRINAIDLHELSVINQLMLQSTWSLRDLFEEVGRARLRGAWHEPVPTPTQHIPSDDHTSDLLTSFEDERSGLKLLFQAHGEPSLKPTGNAEPLEPTIISDFFASDGALSRALPTYEQRAPQVEMAQAVLNTFNESKILLVEAGTGTGKSMAYLVPAAFFAARRGERVVISTNTINLQDQLFFKDIPDVQRIMAGASDSNGQNPVADDTHALPFKAALLKGRSNYLCLRRYKALRPDTGGAAATLQPEEAQALIKVQLWLPTTSSGDRNELRLTEREQTAWGRINVTPDTCTGRRCADFHDCFFFKARRQAEAAHLVVVNHALLIADLGSETSVIPEYNHVIIDEAHNLEDVATSQLSFNVDQAALLEFFDKLYHTGGAQAVSGILSELGVAFSVAERSVQDQAQRIYDEAAPVVEKARKATYDFFAQLMNFINQEANLPNGKRHETAYDERIRLIDAVRQKSDWAHVETAWENLSLDVRQISENLGRLVTLLTEQQAAGLPDFDELLLRAQWLLQYALDVRVQMEHIIHGSEEKICWITRHHVHHTLSINTAPLSVATNLKAKLFDQKQTGILTSATISVNESFAFIKERLGLEDVEELQLESPFDYEQQSMVFIPTDMCEPSQRGYQQMLEDAMIELCTAAGGRTLALFTASNALKQTYAGIQDALEEREIVVLGQNIDGSRRTLLERFKESPRTVLLGTSSFWEGVDVVGDALSVLVITKLPFNVPTDPVFAARSEQFREPFYQYAIPQSILRFKQGFGRLIRSREDRGIVVVLDKRLISKKYGQQFLQSLPATNVRTGALKQLPGVITRFLGSDTE